MNMNIGKKSSGKLLLVEDEKNLAFNLELNLKAEGFMVLYAENGQVAIEYFRNKGPFSVIILDVMLPEIDGFSVAQEIRKTDNKTGILMLTSKAADEDRLKGLEIGVDDYLTKPFHLKELILRVKRMAERSTFYLSEKNAGEEQKERFRAFELGPLKLNTESLSFISPQGKFALTALEADIIGEFMSHPQETLSRKHLLNKVWGIPGNVETRTVDNFILRIRKFIENDPTRPKILLSIRGKGYRLEISK